jgi:hypothetical protein
MYSIMGAEDKEYEVKTEFEVMSIIEELNDKQGKTCNFCGSTNLEIFDIEVGRSGYRLYDFKRLFDSTQSRGAYFYMINIDKRDYSLSPREGGSPTVPRRFIKGAIDRIIDTINDRSDDDFIDHPRGNFLIVISGFWDTFLERPHTTVEKYKSHGLTKDEVLSTVLSLIE